MADLPASRKSPGADRTRRWRDRRRDGRLVVRIEVDQEATARALVAGGYLDPFDVDDVKKITEAVQKAKVNLVPFA